MTSSSPLSCNRKTEERADSTFFARVMAGASLSVGARRSMFKPCRRVVNNFCEIALALARIYCHNNAK